MAPLTVTVPDATQTRILDAFDAAYPGRPVGTTKATWAQARIRDFVKSVTIGYEASQAGEAARAAKVTEVDAAIG
jgi:hypothetical protein